MTEIPEIKCNCTICGSRFRIRVDRQGNTSREARYCAFCRSLLEETNYRKITE